MHLDVNHSTYQAPATARGMDDGRAVARCATTKKTTISG
jgi:hypothetical protein